MCLLHVCVCLLCVCLCVLVFVVCLRVFVLACVCVCVYSCLCPRVFVSSVSFLRVFLREACMDGFRLSLVCARSQLARELSVKDQYIQQLLAQPERRHVLHVRLAGGGGVAPADEESIFLDLSSSDVQSLHQGLELAVRVPLFFSLFLVAFFFSP